ncbi:S-layer homology domain-containing protein [Moorella sp. ACPs]|uniref:S-layer homology domain-containing protein n=1 Tax=Neomoorella carbonis TaxID=3062783 RepID=UPI00324E40F9
MKKFTVLTALLALILLFAQALPAHAEMEYRFWDKKDIDTDFAWGKTDIIEAIDFELYVGYPDSTLRLSNNITRAEFAAVLARAADISGQPGPNWYDGAVNGLIAAGVIPDKSGDWDAPITRLEAARWLGRLAKAFNIPVKDPNEYFTDTQDPEATYARQTGMMYGVDAEKKLLGASELMNRGQAIVILLRVAKNINVDLPSDEEIIQAFREALEDVNAGIRYMEENRKVNPNAYELLPYKRVTKEYFIKGMHDMMAGFERGARTSRVDGRNIRVVEKHKGIAYVVCESVSVDLGLSRPVVSRLRKIDGRWMMTQGAGNKENDIYYVNEWRKMLGMTPLF